MRKKVYSATVTPLSDGGEVDVAGLERILERNVRHGLDGVFVLGSMGECSFLNHDQRERLVAESARIVQGRMELLVGVTDTSVAAILANMQKLSKYEFDSLVFMLPKSSAAAPLADIGTILDAAERPIFYYHCPPNNGVNLQPQEFAQFMRHPKLHGIKNSSSNMWLRRELVLLKRRLGAELLLLEGQEWCVDEALLVGCDGMLCGMGALGSKFMVGIAQAVEQGQVERALALQNRFIALFHAIYGEDLSTVWTGQKYALKLLGLCASEFSLAQPLDTLTEARKRSIAEAIELFRGELD